jgi:hypothetical protein
LAAYWKGKHMPQANGSVVVADYDREISLTNFNLQQVDAAYANIGSVTQDLDELKDAILTLILGEVRKTNFSVISPESEDPVTNQQAAREAKWLVTYKDTTPYLDGLNAIPNPGYGKVFTFEIPTANRALLAANSDTLDITTALSVGKVAATTFAANIRSPYNRSAEAGVTPTNEILSIKAVGRNN